MSTWESKWSCKVSAVMTPHLGSRQVRHSPAERQAACKGTCSPICSGHRLSSAPRNSTPLGSYCLAERTPMCMDMRSKLFANPLREPAGFRKHLQEMHLRWPSGEDLIFR